MLLYFFLCLILTLFFSVLTAWGFYESRNSFLLTFFCWLAAVASGFGTVIFAAGLIIRWLLGVGSEYFG